MKPTHLQGTLRMVYPYLCNDQWNRHPGKKLYTNRWKDHWEINGINCMDDFQIFVKPVGAVCNLACSYCYYLDKQAIYQEEPGYCMHDDLLESYILQHISASTGPDIFFAWHGGEPMLAGQQFFERVIELQQKHLPKNFTIVNGIQTNGTLLDAGWCRFLKENNFIVGISLDGPEDFHSKYRGNRNGQSVFNKVLRGYRLLKDFGIPTEILCVVHSENVHDPLGVYHFFRNLKTEFVTFIPLVEKQNSSAEAVSVRTVPSKAFGEFLCSIFVEWKESDIGAIKVQIFEEALRSAFQLDHTLCIFKKTCGGVPVIEHNGDFYSCDHYVNEENRLGNIRTNSLAELLESPDQKAFGQAKLDSLPQYCLSCEVRDMCNGACPKDRFILTPDGEPGLNYLCEGYKMFFNHCKPFVEQVAEVWRGDQ